MQNFNQNLFSQWFEKGCDYAIKKLVIRLLEKNYTEKEILKIAEIDQKHLQFIKDEYEKKIENDIKNKKREIALEMLKRDSPEDEIIQLTQISHTELEKLKKELLININQYISSQAFEQGCDYADEKLVVHLLEINYTENEILEIANISQEHFYFIKEEYAEKDIEQNKREIALGMLKSNYSKEEIIRLTHLSCTELEQLKEELIIME